jgi:lysozyme
MPQRDVNSATIDLIRKFEGIPDGDPKTVNIDPYLDPVNIWTIGWGHAIRYQNRFLKGPQDQALVKSIYPGGISMDQAVALLHADLVNAGRDVLSVVAVALNDNQFGALTSFAFNLGVGNLSSSTLLKMLNVGNYAGAADEFPRWVRSNGQVLPGLVKRRAAERELFLTPV